MNKKLAIIGAGGHGKVVGEIALLNQYETIDFFDDRVSEIENFPFKIIESFKYLKNNLGEYDAFFVAIGNNQIRENILEWLKKNETNIISLIHPSSIFSKFSTLGVGCCIMANATVNAGSLIKDGVIINTAVSIDHDCVIEDYAHISPNCAISGTVKIGKLTHLGTGTSVHPGINIGKNVKTGVGSRIFKNILNDTVLKN